MFRRLSLLLALLPTVGIVTGCAQNTPEFTERKRIDEELRRSEITRFLRVASDLPEEPLDVLDTAYGELPDWGRTRTLPVAELLRLERLDLDNAWDVERLARHHKPSRRLERALLREKLTYEQFVALALSIGGTLSRSELRPEQDLDAIRERGLAEAVLLERDQRPFASIPPETQYELLQRAAWLTRAHRAEKLANVPDENVELVAEFRDLLTPYFPEDLLANPFDAIVDPLDEYGIPFREPHVENADAELTWSPGEAVVGRDPLDAEFQHDSPGAAEPARLTRFDADVP